MYVAAVLPLVALGLASRLAGMPSFSRLYLGDVLWGSLFFVLSAIARPKQSGLRVWSQAVLVTELIEFSQLYQAPWVRRIRETPLGGLLLGHAFLWSDVICVALGATVAAAVDGCARARRANRGV